jgi:hypothetical protein
LSDKTLCPATRQVRNWRKGAISLKPYGGVFDPANRQAPVETKSYMLSRDMSYDVKLSLAKLVAVPMRLTVDKRRLHKLAPSVRPTAVSQPIDFRTGWQPDPQ